MKSYFDLALHDEDTHRFVGHYRALLAARVTCTSTLVERILRDARVSTRKLSVLAARVARDPDWNSGFENRCLVVVRPAEHPLGRLGFWEAKGMLCMEMQIGNDLLIVHGTSVELRLGVPVSERVRPELVGWLPRDVAAHPVLRGCRGRLLSAEARGDTGATTVSFRTCSTAIQIPQS